MTGSEHELTLLYKRGHYLTINDLSQSIYYYFDYDERAFDINMPFEHMHSFYEIMIPLKPESYHFIEGIPYALQPNDLVLLRPSILHRSEYPKGKPSQRLIIGFMYPDDLWEPRETFELLLRPFYAKLPIFRFHSRQRNLLIEKLNRIYQYSFLDEDMRLKTLMIHTMFIDFLYTLRQILPYNVYNEEKHENRSAQKIYLIANYIHNHYSRDLTLDFLADTFFLNPYYLSHQFKEITGYTLTQYIQRTRIKNVQYQLLNSDKKISAIAEDCGFASFSQFNRIFRKYCDQSPSDYRKNSNPEGLTYFDNAFR